MDATTSATEPADPAVTLSSRTLVACCVAVAIAQMCITIPSPINGAIQSTFGASGAQVAWVTTLFLLPTAILELNFGVIGDLFGRKRLLVGGGLVLALGELVNVLAPSVAFLYAGQILAGIGAAAIFPSSLAVLAAATPQTAARAKALARWALSISLASAAGPLMSGLIANAGDFHYSFLPPVVIGLVAAVMCHFMVTDSKAPQGRSLDWPGQVAIAVALTALLWAVNQGSAAGWGTGPVIAGFVVAAAGLAVFVLVELRTRAPMMNLNLLRIPSFAGSAGIALVGMLGFIGAAYDVSIRLGAVMHLSPLRAGLPFVILQLVPLLLAPLLSRMLSRSNARWMLLAGLLPLAAGQFWLAAIPIEVTSLVAMIGPMLLLGVGFIFVITSLTAVAVNTVPLHLTGMASGATSLVREAGQALGPAVISAVVIAQAGAVLGGHLANAGLTGAQSSAASHVLAAGGPLALVSADMGPGTEKIHAAAQAAMEHGLAIGLIVCGCASLVGALITLIVVKPNATQVAAEPTAAEV